MFHCVWIKNLREIIGNTLNFDWNLILLKVQKLVRASFRFIVKFNLIWYFIKKIKKLQKKSNDSAITALAKSPKQFDWGFSQKAGHFHSFVYSCQSFSARTHTNANRHCFKHPCAFLKLIDMHILICWCEKHRDSNKFQFKGAAFAGRWAEDLSTQTNVADFALTSVCALDWIRRIN